VIFLRDPRNVERAAGDAITTADAVFLVEIQMVDEATEENNSVPVRIGA
jgi:hypothetical protein